MSSAVSRIVQHLQPPYYAVIFTAQRTAGDCGYGAMAERMAALAQQQPGFLGMESTRDDSGLGITVSYWRDEESIRAWKANLDHGAAQRRGQAEWYSAYQLRVCRVEREYGRGGAE